MAVWDVKPFVMKSRLFKVYNGCHHGYEHNLLKGCWSPCGDYIASGSGDRSVVVFEVKSGEIKYKLPGHKGCVNEVDWFGNVIASCGSDKVSFLGEIDLDEVR